MIPADVPDLVKKLRPDGTVFPVGPPRGISDDDCGTIEAHVDVDPELGGRTWRTYWRPDEHELEQLRVGGVVELALWTPQLVMQAMSVVGPAEPAADGT